MLLPLVAFYEMLLLKGRFEGAAAPGDHFMNCSFYRAGLKVLLPLWPLYEMLLMKGRFEGAAAPGGHFMNCSCCRGGLKVLLLQVATLLTVPSVGVV